MEAAHALAHKITSQSIKKSKKNQSRLPRTAGLRTLTDLTTEMTAAGLDPSKIQERAVMLAKVHGAKRKRDMDVDMEDGEGEDDEGEEADWMDVDGQEAPTLKRAKGNSGGVVALDRRAPKTDRRLAGMRDEAQASRAVKLRNLGQRPRNMLAKAGEGDRVIKTKMVGASFLNDLLIANPGIFLLLLYSRNICSLGNVKVAKQIVDDSLLFLHLVSLWLVKLSLMLYHIFVQWIQVLYDMSTRIVST